MVGTHSRAGSSNNKNNKRNRTGSTLDVPPSPLTHSGQMRQHSTVRRMCARAPCALFWVRAIVFLSGAAFPNPVPSPRPDGWVRRNARTHPGQAQANDGRQRERDGCAQGERRCRFSAFLFDEPCRAAVCASECALRQNGRERERASKTTGRSALSPSRSCFAEHKTLAAPPTAT